MTIGETFSRSWEITKHTFHVISADKEILIFPVLASIFSVLFFLLMAVPFLMSGAMSAIGLENAEAAVYYLLMFVFYLGVAFIATFFNVSVVYCARKRFEGGDPTFGEGLNAAIRRIHLIFAWSLVSATVGLLLRLLENSVRKSRSDLQRFIMSAIVGLLGMAWSIVSIFVVPAIVFENVGPFEELKRSASAIKKTWGESLIRHYGLGLIQTLFTFAGIFVILIPGILLLPAGLIGLVLIGVFVLYLVVVSLVFGTANTVFNTALYMYAKGHMPKVFSKETLEHAFVSG